MQLLQPSLLPAAADIARHHHREPYATVVLTGAYEEAGDAGRIAARAGEVLFHGPFSAHRDRISAKGTVGLSLPLPFDGRDWRPRGRVADPDHLVRLAERDPVEAVTALLDGLAPTTTSEEEDLPDQLSAALRTSEPPKIGEWAAARGR